MLHFHVEATQAHESFSKFCKAVFVWPDLMAFEVLVCAWEPQCLKKVISSIFSAVSGMDSFPEIYHVWACLVLNIIETTLFFRNYPSKLTNSCLQSWNSASQDFLCHFTIIGWEMMSQFCECYGLVNVAGFTDFLHIDWSAFYTRIVHNKHSLLYSCDQLSGDDFLMLSWTLESPRSWFYWVVMSGQCSLRRMLIWSVALKVSTKIFLWGYLLFLRWILLQLVLTLLLWMKL